MTRTHPPASAGDRNENPPGLSLWRLLREDWETHDRSVWQPGLWAVAVHRFGNWRMGFRWKAVRGPLTLLYRVLYFLVQMTAGISLSYTVRLGRRVRLWHHGGMVLGAVEIGDDVHIRHNTTFGLARRGGGRGDKPVIGPRADIGCGAVVLGPVLVGHDSVVGANAVVVADVPPWAVAAGVPARVVAVRGPAAGREPPPYLLNGVAPGVPA